MITSSSDTTSETAIPVFESSFLYAATFLLFFASPKSLALSTCHTASELGKQLKTCVLPIVCSPTATSKHFKSSYSTFSQLYSNI
jgi:hypothetical protein